MTIRLGQGNFAVWLNRSFRKRFLLPPRLLAGVSVLVSFFLLFIEYLYSYKLSIKWAK